MGPILSGLIKLQSVENRLGAAKIKLTRCRRSVVLQENQVRTLQNALEVKKEDLQLTRIQCDRLELELKSRDEAVAKSRASLNLAKTNKEYSAILTQLNTTKADNSKLEAQILELMKDIEAEEAEIAGIKEQIDEQKTLLDKIRKDSESNAVKFEDAIREIQAEWDQHAEPIPAEQLEVFKRVAETYDGEALSYVDAEEGKTTGYSCGGCFMGVTAETVNLLMTNDEILRCPNCTRILVLGSEPES